MEVVRHPMPGPWGAFQVASAGLIGCNRPIWTTPSERRRPELVPRKVSGDKGLWHWILAERLAKDRPMHRLVAEDAGDGLSAIAVTENRDHA